MLNSIRIYIHLYIYIYIYAYIQLKELNWKTLTLIERAVPSCCCVKWARCSLFQISATSSAVTRISRPAVQRMASHNSGPKVLRTEQAMLLFYNLVSLLKIVLARTTSRMCTICIYMYTYIIYTCARNAHASIIL